MQIDEAKLAEIVAEKLASEYPFQERVSDLMRDMASAAVGAYFKSHADQCIRDALLPVVSDAFQMKLRRTNTWGDPTGEAVTLAEYVESEMLSAFDDGSKLSKEVSKLIDKTVVEFVREVIDRKRASIEAQITAALGNVRIKLG